MRGQTASFAGSSNTPPLQSRNACWPLLTHGTCIEARQSLKKSRSLHSAHSSLSLIKPQLGVASFVINAVHTLWGAYPTELPHYLETEKSVSALLKFRGLAAESIHFAWDMRHRSDLKFGHQSLGVVDPGQQTSEDPQSASFEYSSQPNKHARQ